jgi:flagellar assembly protein FliH
MPISHLLQSFELVKDPGESVSLLSESELEEVRLRAFEQGYKAGWDDAFKAQSNDQGRILSTLGRNLEDLSFTYQEALAHLNATIAPVLSAIVDRVLPAVFRDSVGHMIIQEAEGMIRDRTGKPVVIAVPQGVAETIRPLLDAGLAMPIVVEEDATLLDQQAMLRFGETEKEVDVARLIHEAQEIVGTFAYAAQKELAHG